MYEGQSWTFKQFYDMVLRYAGWLHNTYNIQPKEVIAMDFMNCPQFLFLSMALWSLGAIPALINYNLTGAPLIHSVRASTARFIFIDPAVRASITAEVAAEFASPTFRNGASSIEVVFLEKAFESSLPYYPPFRAPNTTRAGTTGKDVSVLIYTSGTTGMPKAAILTWNRIQVTPGFTHRWLGLNPVYSKNPDRFYTCMPLYHSAGFVLAFLPSLWRGSTLVLGHRFGTKSFWRDVTSHDATVIQYVGETLRYLFAAPVTPAERANKVRLAFGNGLRPDIFEKVRQRFGITTIAEFYGATEGTSASWNYSNNTFASGAVGRNGTFLKLILRKQSAIVRLDHVTQTPYRDPTTGFFQHVSPGEIGEQLYALDPSDIFEKYHGYFGNPSATESKIFRDVFAKGDAWYRTGDLLREDSEGRLYFSDRIGDTFRWKSENVSTNEVAEVLGGSPHVLEANVYGVEVPGHDGRAGCSATVFSEPEPSVALLSSVAQLVWNSLPRYAVPIFLRVVKEVQATGNNKQQKHVLRMQGVDPAKVPSDEKIYWMKGGTYVPFEVRDWEALGAGKVKL